jgi:VanZ family protein
MTLKRTIRFLPPILWMAFMFFLSSRSDLPSNQVYAVDFIIKKASHVAEYFILTVLWNRALKRNSPDLAILFALMYAFSDETHQLFVPNRSGALRDVGIDFLGISAAAFIMINLKPWKKFTFPHPSKTHKA